MFKRFSWLFILLAFILGISFIPSSHAVESVAMDNNGKVIQALRWGQGENVAYTASSVQSAAAIGATVVRLICTTDCWVEIGANPTATTTTSTRMQSEVAEYVKILPTDIIAAIRDAASGTLNITAID